MLSVAGAPAWAGVPPGEKVGNQSVAVVSADTQSKPAPCDSWGERRLVDARFIGGALLGNPDAVAGAVFGEAKYGELAAGRGTLLQSLLYLGADLAGAWETLYADMAESAVEMADAAAGPREHSGPLVRLGEMSRPEWLALATKSIDPALIVAADSIPANEPRLGPWLTKEFSHAVD